MQALLNQVLLFQINVVVLLVSFVLSCKCSECGGVETKCDEAESTINYVGPAPTLVQAFRSPRVLLRCLSRSG
jgi:hypothetical protein